MMNLRNPFLKTLLPLLCVVALTTGCPPVGDDIAPLPTPENPTPPAAPQNPDPAPVEKTFDVVGAWRHENGDFFNLETFGYDVEFIDLRGDGTMTIHIREFVSGVLLCFDSLYVQIADDAILMSDGSDNLDSANSIFGTRLLTIASGDESSLELFDTAQGDAITFARVESVPETSQCLRLKEASRIEDLPEPEFDTGLAFDGSALYYTDDFNNVIAVDPTNEAVGSPIPLTAPYNRVHASQGQDFWVHCDCFDTKIVERRSRNGTVVDTVTEGEVGALFGANAIAFDAGEKLLYVFAEANDDDDQRLLKINAEGEPDVLVDSASFGESFVSGATMHQGRLFALLDFNAFVVEIDPATLKPVRTYSFDGDFIEWHGLASVGDDLYLVGSDFRKDDDRGVIARFSAE